MASSNDMSETGVLLTTIVSAIVAEKEAVRVTNAAGSGGEIIFRVVVAAKDRGKVIGKQGRTARSLRVVLSAIGKKSGQNYSLDVDGSTAAESSSDEIRCPARRNDTNGYR